jgi:hypothetical protein
MDVIISRPQMEINLFREYIGVLMPPQVPVELQYSSYMFAADTEYLCQLESIAEFKSKSKLYVVSGPFLMLYLQSS